ncbi:MAG: DNA mismatch repair endonuclease MutL [Alphaproteobacteria bacterium]|nr:DNA mismatch repair endonuclease MutL [Alphaproteobacteria bacterium]MBX9977442.1 DNA mismatch repair endonuclease MutL [Alphaproteobacteria bacterium]
MSIRFLGPVLINQIAAGEVVEKPSSVIKELVENSLDAGATLITVTLREGGRTYISVQDNGSGMHADDLALCVERHATSKIPDENLFNIRSLGFRGEALAAISAVARVNITTRRADANTALCLSISGGEKESIIPANGSVGTTIEVRDLFYATPARLKFLKTTNSELSSCLDVMERLALSHLHSGFKVIHNDRVFFEVAKEDSLEIRLSKVLATDFMDNAVPIRYDHAEDGLQISGYIGLTTYTASQANKQYFFVNHRPVKDKLLHTAMKVAYADYLAKGRHPVCSLFLTLDPMAVDMNVHPAKIEVRFMQGNKLRDTIISLVHNHLRHQGTMTSTHLTRVTMEAFRAPYVHRSPITSPMASYQVPPIPSNLTVSSSTPVRENSQPRYQVPLYGPSIAHRARSNVAVVENYQPPFYNENISDDHCLGQAQAQLFNSYIISQTEDAFYLVDQHAAAERLLYEKFKQQMATGGVDRQLLLIPDIVDMKESDRAILVEYNDMLKKLGFIVDIFGINQVIVKEIPALLKDMDIKKVILDMASDLNTHALSTQIEERILEKLSTKACHGSVRFGRKLSVPEMNALLRSIEATPFSNQCNHGRPSFIKLTRGDLERLFERA